MKRTAIFLIGLLAALGISAATATSPIAFLGVQNNFAPVVGLGNLNDGLYNDFRKGSLVSQRGPAFSLTRATVTTTVDSSDLVQNVSSGAPRWWRIGAASGATGLWVHQAHTNIVLQSENHGTTWAAIAATSPTRVAANDTCGVVVLDLLGDDSGVLAEGYTQTVTFTGNAAKTVAVFMKAGTSTNSAIRLRDTVGLANRLLVSIAWSGGVPTPTMTTGTHEGTDVLGNGVYRLRFITTSVTAANTNVLEIYPASDAALAGGATGTVNVGGWMVLNALENAPYVKTTTGSVTVDADVVTAPGAGVITTEGTMYARVIGPAVATGNHVLFSMDDGTGNETAFLQQVSSIAQLNMSDGGAAQALVSGANLTAGVVSKIAARFKLNDSTFAKDGVVAAADTACTMPTMTTFRIGYGGGGFQPNTVIQEVAYSRTGASDAQLTLATT